MAGRPNGEDSDNYEPESEDEEPGSADEGLADGEETPDETATNEDAGCQMAKTMTTEPSGKYTRPVFVRRGWGQ
jgi:hypothetical protein